MVSKMSPLLCSSKYERWGKPPFLSRVDILLSSPMWYLNLLTQVHRMTNIHKWGCAISAAYLCMTPGFFSTLTTSLTATIPAWSSHIQAFHRLLQYLMAQPITPQVPGFDFLAGHYLAHRPLSDRGSACVVGNPTAQTQINFGIVNASIYM
ncbi:hypothetical protein IW261DRAFT_1039025 [Armillaria novae-zelandiae]|uniref:Uncharacterized protein n=1 Tax=Armillaria novae-zelandiae TaxID=153914 RepID=A0AA39UAX5_9AGAR|nr:hypothetical protein IW261DRAFT_1039025 [Armillaria novae-zelandiae]